MRNGSGHCVLQCFIACFTTLILCGYVFAGAPTAGSERTLKILSYNIKGLPWPLAKDDGRFRMIAEVLRERRRAGNAPDIVLLQEDFSVESSMLREQAGFAYVVREQEHRGSIGSGLTIMSDIPIRSVKYQRFGSACSGTDCLADKGVVAVEVDLGDDLGSIWVATTHLQAHAQHDEMRTRQMSMAVEFLGREIGFSRTPLIFAGDFNTKPARESYGYFLGLAPLEDVGRTCLDHTNACTILTDENGNTSADDIWQKPHDRHFVYSPVAGITGVLRLAPVSAQRNFTMHYPGRYQDGYLSDHFGYEVTYKVFRD